MSNTLFEICDAKREHVKLKKKAMPEPMVMTRSKQVMPPRGFVKALKAKADKGEFGLIAELKKASPSKGLIREDFDPAKLAAAYEAGGATCLSVLTDEPYFQGKDEHLQLAKAAVKLPVLRKDFIVDPYQVYESRMLGADCILLIMSVLSDRQAEEMEAVALSLGMDVLVEVHDITELNRALMVFRSGFFGVNNRNLRPMEIDMTTAETLGKRIPDRIFKVCESGIESHADLLKMRDAGYLSFLVGGTLMAQPDVTAATQKLLNG